MAVRISHGAAWRRADPLSHGQSPDYSSRSAPRNARPGDQRLSHGSGVTLGGFNGDGYICYDLWRAHRAGAVLRFFDGADRRHLFPFPGQDESAELVGRMSRRGVSRVTASSHNERSLRDIVVLGLCARAFRGRDCLAQMCRVDRSQNERVNEWLAEHKLDRWACLEMTARESLDG